MMTQEQDMEKWARERFPRVAGNKELVAMLYKRKVLNQPTSLPTMAYPLSRLVELKPNSVVTLIITKIDSTVKQVEVCKVCNRSKCVDTTHGTDRNTLFIVSMMAGDESGYSRFERFCNDKPAVEAIQNNDEFIVSGTLKVDEKYGNSFSIKSIAPLTKEQLKAWDDLEDYSTVHGGIMGIDGQAFEMFIADKKDKLVPFFERIFIHRENGRIKW